MLVLGGWRSNVLLDALAQLLARLDILRLVNRWLRIPPLLKRTFLPIVDTFANERWMLLREGECVFSQLYILKVGICRRGRISTLLDIAPLCFRTHQALIFGTLSFLYNGPLVLFLNRRNGRPSEVLLELSCPGLGNILLGWSLFISFILSIHEQGRGAVELNVLGGR